MFLFDSSKYESKLKSLKMFRFMFDQTPGSSKVTAASGSGTGETAEAPRKRIKMVLLFSLSIRIFPVVDLKCFRVDLNGPEDGVLELVLVYALIGFCGLDHQTRVLVLIFDFLCL